MIKLQNCPTDSISCLKFAPSSNTLAASSWDSVGVSPMILIRHCTFIQLIPEIVFKPINRVELFSAVIFFLTPGHARVGWTVI